MQKKIINFNEIISFNTHLMILLMLSIQGCSGNKEIEKLYMNKDPNDLIKIEISSIDLPRIIYNHDIISEKEYYYFPVLLKITNTSDQKLTIDSYIRVAGVKFPPRQGIILDTCGAISYEGRRYDMLNMYFPHTKVLKPNQYIVDTAFYNHCQLFNGLFQVRYAGKILDKKNNRIDNIKYQILSNTIYLNYDSLFKYNLYSH
ncbi:MAG: hypothetical protein WCI92_00075 [Bacteroidota bacterium]